MDLQTILNPEKLLSTVGYIGVFAVIFAESGLFFGFFLPGDSLLFTAGFFAFKYPEQFSLPILIVGCFAAAVLGDSVGYAFGNRVGQGLFSRPDGRFFKKKYIEQAHAFYEKNGNRTIVLARFVPIVRTFAPIVAGISKMQYRNFLTYNIVGGLLWAVGLNIAGYLTGRILGQFIDVDKFLLPIIALVILISLLPAILHVVQDKEMREGLIGSVRRLVSRDKQAS